MPSYGSKEGHFQISIFCPLKTLIIIIATKSKLTIIVKIYSDFFDDRYCLNSTNITKHLTSHFYKL